MGAQLEGVGPAREAELEHLLLDGRLICCGLERELVGHLGGHPGPRVMLYSIGVLFVDGSLHLIEGG